MKTILMKRAYALLASLALLWGLPVSTHATLIDRGGGMIYDTDLNITWLQDANYAKTSGYDANGTMTWYEAMTWASNLIYGGYDNWRLPTSDSNCSFLNCNGSEMGHLFYDEFGGTAWSSILTITDSDLALFINIYPSYYWSGTELLPGTALGFSFGDSTQDFQLKVEAFHAWAVRDGDVTSVPEPSTLLLFGFSLLGFWFFTIKKFRQRQG